MRLILCFLFLCTLSPLFSKSASWQLSSVKEQKQQAHHPLFSLHIHIEPPISSLGKYYACSKNLLIIDTSPSKKWGLWKQTLQEQELKKWDIRLYVMDKMQWLVWKQVLVAQDISILQMFENTQMNTIDCVLKKAASSQEEEKSDQDELWRFWLYLDPVGMNERLIAKGRFLKTLASPVCRKNGCARFLYTLDASHNIEIFDTLRGYLKKQAHVPEATDIEFEPIQDGRSRACLKVKTANHTYYLDAYNLQPIESSTLKD